MGFYELLQLDPCVLKPMARCERSGRGRFRIWVAIVVRSALIVAFATVFVAGLSHVFGSESTPLSVGVFCLLLGIRFVDFGYRSSQAIAALFGCFAILLCAPQLSQAVPAPLLLPFHFCMFFPMVFLTCQHPGMGNAGLYGFAYIYSVGNPVPPDSLAGNAAVATIGFLLCSAVYLKKHRGKFGEVTILSRARSFSARNADCLWMLRMALGTSLALSMGAWLDAARAIWIAFPCAAMLSTYPYARFEFEKGVQRIVGVVGGSIAFFALCQLLPENMRVLLALVGGFCLGLSVDYRFKTAFNCFGALVLANGLFGVGGSVFLRVLDAILGTAGGLGFMAAFHLFAKSRLPVRADEMKQGAAIPAVGSTGPGSASADAA